MSCAMSTWMSSFRAPHGRTDAVTARLGARALAKAMLSRPVFCLIKISRVDEKLAALSTFSGGGERTVVRQVKLRTGVEQVYLRLG